MDDDSDRTEPGYKPLFAELGLLVLVMVATALLTGRIGTMELLVVEVVFFLTPLTLWVIGRIGLPLPKWIVFNVGGIAFGIVGAAVIAERIEMAWVVGAFLVLIVYDYLAVHRSDAMSKLGKGAFKLNLPLAVIIPLSSEHSHDDLRKVISNGGFDGIQESDLPPFTLIGLGDLVIPSVLACVALSISATWLTVGGFAVPLGTLGAVVGAVTGLYVLRRFAPEGPMAGMLTLVPGTLGGYLVGAIIAGAPLVTALGL